MRIAVTDAQTTRPLRRAVLRPTWPADSAMHGDENVDALHYAAFDDGTVIGACLVLPRAFPGRPHEDGAWQLRGMATADGRRREGIGAALLATAIDEVVRRGGRLMWCEARTSAMRFYLQHGFAVDGAEYSHAETGIPHHVMWRRVGPGRADREPCSGSTSSS